MALEDEAVLIDLVAEEEEEEEDECVFSKGRAAARPP